ncbi:MAG: transglycosylase domain-containing protein, partial [bacterium]
MNRVRGTLAAGTAGLLLVGALLTVPLPVSELTPPPSTWVTDSGGGTLRVYVNSRGDFHRPVTLEEVSPFLIASTTAFEDRFFRRHPGINPFSVLRAAWQNLLAGEVVSGGSTLTQQVARLMDPAPRTLGAKMVEAFRALQLELRFSKDEILTHYFNLAPYGGNLVGVGAAAWAYFGKAPSELSPGEAALLSALPNNPASLRPDRDPGAARARRDEVLRRMRARGIVDEVRYRNALTEPVPERRRPLPMYAPHAGDMVR